MTVAVVLSVRDDEMMRHSLPPTRVEVAGSGRLFLYYLQSDPSYSLPCFEHEGMGFYEARTFVNLEEADAWVAERIARCDAAIGEALPFPYTIEGDAAYFVALHRNDIRYVQRGPDKGWQGRGVHGWRGDANRRRDLGMELFVRRHREASAIPDAEQRQAALTWATKGPCWGVRLTRMLALVRKQLQVAEAEPDVEMVAALGEVQP